MIVEFVRPSALAVCSFQSFITRVLSGSRYIDGHMPPHISEHIHMCASASCEQAVMGYVLQVILRLRVCCDWYSRGVPGLSYLLANRITRFVRLERASQIVHPLPVILGAKFSHYVRDFRRLLKKRPQGATIIQQYSKVGVQRHCCEHFRYIT